MQTNDAALKLHEVSSMRQVHVYSASDILSRGQITHVMSCLAVVLKIRFLDAIRRCASSE
jgi:hypothetical protein